MTTANIAQKKVELTEELKAAFGNVQTSAPNETKKVPIMSYSNGQVYIGLKAVSTFDAKTGTYRVPQPRITASFGGHFVELPLSDPACGQTACENITQEIKELETILLALIYLNCNWGYFNHNCMSAGEMVEEVLPIP